ncbi:UNVERIFIED_CONTAM: hypothetical protein GTU68_046323 [Idotea baltica]|nr:hypothetical protein [Idotea baltica]
MKTKNGLIALAFIAIFTLTSATILKTTDPVKTATNQTSNIVGVAVANKNFTTLVAAVKAADLVATLSGDGPFTVFAPTNDAFAKLPEGTIATLLKPENKAKLTSILTYHVVAGKFDAAATVQGDSLIASLDGGNVMLKDEKGNMSKVVIADVAASNGVIHAIDSVVMPK